MWLGNAVTSSTLHADPPSNETKDVFHIKKQCAQALESTPLLIQKEYESPNRVKSSYCLPRKAVCIPGAAERKAMFDHITTLLAINP